MLLYNLCWIRALLLWTMMTYVSILGMQMNTEVSAVLLYYWRERDNWSKHMQTRLSKKILSCVSLKLKLSNLIIIMYFLACERLSSLVNSDDGMCKLCKPYSAGPFQYHYFITWNATIKWDNDSWKWEDVLKFITRMLSGRKHYVEREWLSPEPLEGGESWKRSPSLERKGCF